MACADNDGKEVLVLYSRRGCVSHLKLLKPLVRLQLFLGEDVLDSPVV